MKGAFLNHLPNILPPERHEEQLGVAAPSKNDVLVGKGCVCNGHHGNKSYRALVDSRKRDYIAGTTTQRTYLIQSIVGQVRAKGGKFLEKDKFRNRWFDVGDSAAFKKTQTLLRRTSSTLRAKKVKRKSELIGFVDDMISRLESHSAGLSSENRNDRISDFEKHYLAENAATELDVILLEKNIQTIIKELL